jgi:hypothetical protein
MNTAYRPFDGDAWLGRDLPLPGGPYRIAAENAFKVADEIAFARQGRKSRVFKVVGPDGATHALKTFYRGFSLPEYGAVTTALAAFGDLPGLRTCQRRLVSPEEAAAAGEPGLAYAVLMPWIEGVSWASVVEQRFPLPAPTCLALAAQTAEILARIEAAGLVHADISSTNVVITDTDSGPAIELIDVEDMYHDNFVALPYVPDGSPGYAHPRNRGRGCRNPFGDRFAGAVLAVEMLVWPELAVRQACADISVFEPSELCRGGEKYVLVRKLLQAQSPAVATLFERVWDSPGPSGCPRLSEWAAAINTVSLPDGTTEPVLDAAEPAHCPGCAAPLLPGRSIVDHALDCPLRARSAAILGSGKSVFPGVPSHDGIGFVPLFGFDLS